MRNAVLWVVALGAGCAGGTAPHINWLYGNWRWAESCGGVAYQCLNPATEGYQETLRLDPSGKYVRFRDGAAVARGTYSVIPDSDSATFQLRFDGGEALAGSLGGDTLHLDEGCCDRFEHHYVRP